MSAVIEEPTQTAIVDMQLHHEIADFLYMEAELLDDWQFRDWLDLLSEDIHREAVGRPRGRLERHAASLAGRAAGVIVAGDRCQRVDCRARIDRE